MAWPHAGRFAAAAEETVMLTVGTKLGPYEIQSPLGAGGMGEVYRARDTRLDRTAAIKILPQHLTAKANVKQRFEREARAISSLQHPNICTLYDVGHQDGTDFLVMEYLEGETRAQREEMPELHRANASGKPKCRSDDHGLKRWRPLAAKFQGRSTRH
jgi:serine/threonine protein kinase